MPKPRKRRIWPLAGAMVLSGCMGGLQPPVGLGAALSSPAAPGTVAPALAPAQGGVIAELRARRSVLPASGSYATVAQAVLAANSGAAGAELQVARLQAQAVDKNWLPSIGPVVTLDRLGALAAQIVAEQALLDNGRRRAERAVAAADVDLAAVALSADLNDKVRQGLVFYIRAEQARAQAAVASRGVERLSAFQDMVAERVGGGLSDASELQIVEQKRAEMQATYLGDMQAADRAMSDLAALTGRPLAALRGIDPLTPGQAEALSVLQARAAGARALAMAQAQQAQLLPGLSATVGLDQNGTLNPGLRLDGGALGPGMGARRAVAEATPDLVARQLAEARQEAGRALAGLQAEAGELRQRQAQGAGVLRQVLGNLDLFVEQYRAGKRSLVELVGQYDAAIRLERDQAALDYEIALREVQIAAQQGLLIDGQAA